MTTPGKHDLGDGRKPLEGEMWFAVDDQPVFAVTGFWQRTKKGSGFAMVTCAPNQLVAPIHLKAMITIPAEGDRDPWLTGGCQDVTALQQSFAADHKSARRPMCPTRQ